MTTTTQTAIASGTLARRINSERIYLMKLISLKDYNKLSHQQRLLISLEEAQVLVAENYEGGCAAIAHKQAATARRLKITLELGRFDLVSQVAGESSGWTIAKQLLACIELEELAS